MTVELRVLGSLRLNSSVGRDLDPLMRQSKRIALLAYLAAAVPHGFHRRDTLLAMFWPELDTTRARSALNQALYVLRTALGDQILLTRGDGEVGVHTDALWCDTAAFEEALDAGRPGDALALYRGELLAGFFIEDAPAFEHWLDEERTRLRLRASEGAWTLADAHASDGRIAEATRWARRAAELLPDDETVVRRLMTFFHRLGDRAAAIRAYEAFIWRLSAEFELEPSAETHALAAAIREETSHSVAVHVRKLLPAPFSAALHRIERRIPLGWMVAATMALLVFAAGAWSGVRQMARSSAPVVRFALQSGQTELVTAGVTGSTVAISPAGDRVVYLAETPQRGVELFARSMDRLDPGPIVHTRGAYLPFFSPDGKWLGFVVDGVMRKAPLAGGPAITICRVGSRVMGASWGDNEVIVFANAEGLWQVSARGNATPRVVASADTAHGVRYRWPEVLPGGKAVVFTLVDGAGFRLATVDLESGTVASLDLEGASPHFVDPSHLVFARTDGALLAVPFDVRERKIDGSVLSIADGITVGTLGAAKLGVSRAGTIAFIPERVEDRVLMLVDRNGRAKAMSLPPQRYHTARFSPTGRSIAVDIVLAGPLRDVWTFDLDRNTADRITYDSANYYPQWSPDGARIVVATASGGRASGFEIRSIATKGRDTAETLLAAEVNQIPMTFTPDGGTLIVQRERVETRRDIWMLPLDAKRELQPYLRSPADERAAMISPNGRWLAYVSDESGRDEVYVRAFPSPGEARRVSDHGGSEPRWSPKGLELFYRTDSGMVAIGFEPDRQIQFGPRKLLFADHQYIRIPNGAGYDVHPDGEHFLMIRRGSQAKELVVVLNGLEQLRSSRR